jgi:uncharacterized protein YlxP (DUF503 family)
MPEKNKKIKQSNSYLYSKDPKLLKKIYDENKDKIEAIQRLFSPIQKKYNIGIAELIRINHASSEIPISIFNKKISSLETVTKYLKEDVGLKYHDIAEATGRDERNIWHTYSEALKKHPKRLEFKESKFSFPVSLLKETRLSVLEAIVWHLKKTYDLRFTEISKLLQRDTKTVWTCYQRALQKNGTK